MPRYHNRLLRGSILFKIANFSSIYPVSSCSIRNVSFTNKSSIPSKTNNSSGSTRTETWCQYYDRPLSAPIESTSVLLFPGHGSQFLGMSKNLIEIPGVKDMFNCASSVLRTDLLKTCLEGPLEKLRMTIHCQPAVYVTSLAAVKKLQHDSPDLVEKCVATAGCSLGEISALVFAGAFTFEEGLHLIRVRAEHMQRASDTLRSGMCSVCLTHDSQLRPALAAATNHCKENLKMKDPVVCQVAIYISPDCKIIAGNSEALEFIESHAAQFRLQSVTRLSVSGAFHTPLMLTAVEPFRNALKRIQPARCPAIPVISNISAEPHANGSSIAHHLIKSLTKPIRWEQCLHALYTRPEEAAFPKTVEVGPGRTLGDSLCRVNAKAFARYDAVEV